jgi:enoyl-CoA hydratase
MPAELAECVEKANLDPEIHVIALSGSGKGFCGGYDLVAAAEQRTPDRQSDRWPTGSPMDLSVQYENHAPESIWDPMTDFAMMSRNVHGFMSLFFSDKPVVCKIHGFCVGGGTDLALCSDLIIIEETARIGYPPVRAWGVPTTALWALRIGTQRAKRLLFTGDSLTGKEAAEWGLACESAPASQLDQRFENLLERIARVPVNQLMMHKMLLNQGLMAQGLYSSQMLGTLFDGIARHTKEGYAFQKRAKEAGFKQAVRERDEPFEDFGASVAKK